MVTTGEEKVGLREFITDTRGTGGKLRREPGDFRVREMSMPPPEQEDGNWTIATVTATNWETNKLVRYMSRRLRISRSRIRFAGTKDKRAVTSQLMAFKMEPDGVRELRLKDVEIDDIFRSNHPISIGDLIGNEFDILITDVEEGGFERAEDTTVQIKDCEGFPNYFGLQRFGILRPVTHIVGKHMIRGEFEKAVLAYLATVSPLEDEGVQEVRGRLGQDRDFERANREFPKRLSFERSMLQHLARREGDYIGALRQLPKNLLWMFVHAYQSYLFNLILSERMRRKVPLNTPVPGDIVLPTDRNRLPLHDEWIPTQEYNLPKVRKQVRRGRAMVSALVIGTETDFAEGIQGEIERKIVQEEGIENRDFVVPEMPEVSSKGIRREVLAPAFRLRCEKEDDGVRLTFKLNKGCYATCLLREYMKSEDVLAY